MLKNDSWSDIPHENVQSSTKDLTFRVFVFLDKSGSERCIEHLLEWIACYQQRGHELKSIGFLMFADFFSQDFPKLRMSITIAEGVLQDEMADGSWVYFE